MSTIYQAKNNELRTNIYYNQLSSAVPIGSCYEQENIKAFNLFKLLHNISSLPHSDRKFCYTERSMVTRCLISCHRNTSCETVALPDKPEIASL